MIELTDYKRMTMTSLVNAAKTILEKDGIDGITIRKVGELARFNSATIYNYFENLEHLKIFACLFSFNEYLDDLKNYIHKDDNILDIYYGIWECFTIHTMENPEVFSMLFFNNLERTISDYISDFYILFPVEDRDYGDVVDNMLKNNSIESRNIILLYELDKQGYLKADSVDYINDLSSFTYESILYRVVKKYMSEEEGGDMLKKYIREIVESKLVK